jgi:hypothetical protein
LPDEYTSAIGSSLLILFCAEQNLGRRRFPRSTP